MKFAFETKTEPVTQAAIIAAVVAFSSGSLTMVAVYAQNNSYLPVLGRGTVIISLNGQRVLVRHALHVPGLAVPLYSLRAHLKQPGCGFLGNSDSGMLDYFPSFILSVDTSSDCHLSYEPLGTGASLESLHYVQRRCSPSLYPSELTAARNATISTPIPTLVPDDGSSDGDPATDDDDGPSDGHGLIWVAPHMPNCVQPSSSDPPVVIPPDNFPPSASSPSESSTPSFDFKSVLDHLRSLANAVQNLSCPVTMADLADSPVPPPTLLSALPQEKIMEHFHHPGSPLPAVRPCDTANASDTKTHWSGEEIHRIMGCQKFRNYKHILHVSRDGEYIDGGEFPPSLGSFATIPKAKQGKLLDRSRYRYLDAVHMDIAFGDCLSVGGFRYALILVDRATRYNWTFGLKSLSSDCILAALRLFRAAAGSLARCFYCDCDAKLFGTAISEYLIDNGSKIVSAPAKRQSTNGLIESHWKVMVHMARAYLTEKQMPRSYWFFAITHAARMMNIIPSKVDSGLASPFLLVHGVGHDERTWIPLFSLCYFHHTKDGDLSRSKHQAHTMDGIIIGRSPTSNALLVYNPQTKQYYEPDSYRIDSYRLPGSVYSDIKYDGGFFCSLHRDDNPSFEEKYPPGTRIERIDPSTKMLLAGTVMDIPFPTDVSDPNATVSYTILFDNGTSASVPVSDMSSILPAPPVDVATCNSQDSLLPSFLQLNSKITYEHDGQYHKGYLGKRDGIFRFVFKSHVNKRKEDWGVDLPNLPVTWVDMCVKGILIPGYVSHTFLCSPASPQQSTFDPVASFVSAVNLHKDCLPTLLKALADTHPDREIWMQSYFEEKHGIESMGTFTKITLGEYRALREKGVPCAIPTMCVLTIKRMNNSSLFGQSLVSLSWEITKTEFGAKAIILPQSFVATLFVSLSASQ